MQVNNFSRKVVCATSGGPPAVGPSPSSRVIASTNRAEARVTPTARSTNSGAIKRRWITTSVRFSRVERVAPISTAKVVVLMPPPVPPGLAPTNIRAIISSRPASERVVIERGTVLKPAVRVVIDWNRVTWRRCHSDRDWITPSGANCSVTSSPTAPSTISRAVLRSTSRVWRLRWRRLQSRGCRQWTR